MGSLLNEWTKERTAQLVELINAGATAGEAAAKIGRVTRAAVIGKATRLGLKLISGNLGGLSNLHKRKAAERVAKGIPEPRMRVKTSKPLPAPTARPVLVCELISLMELTLTTCRWPVDGDGADTQFCGAQVHETRVYCKNHSAITFKPTLPAHRIRVPG